ncbi:hypothetical protein PR048_031356 [Dryococelus australis]|uniref:Uncharacterized protein n=1 Tax=Dryococelus australis TaxID=614101 RepID=A0ABQ9G942_9NEOP|nr:hypothetical protein PR048_031356 [Dryococelus australis]
MVARSLWADTSLRGYDESIKVYEASKHAEPRAVVYYEPFVSIKGCCRRGEMGVECTRQLRSNCLVDRRGRSEASMEQRRKHGRGEAGDPRENPPDSVIARHEHHVATLKHRRNNGQTGFDSRQGRPPRFSHVGIVPDDAAGRLVYSGISRFPPPVHSGAAPYSPHFALIGFQDLDVGTPDFRETISRPVAFLNTSAQIHIRNWASQEFHLIFCPLITDIQIRSNLFLIGQSNKYMPSHKDTWPMARRKLLAVHDKTTRLPPGRNQLAPGFSHVVIVTDDAAGWRIFSGTSRFPSPIHSGAAPHSPRFTLIGFQDLDFKNRPQFFTHSHLVRLCLHEVEEYPGSRTLGGLQKSWE